ncbi:hypothetical protein ABZP36_029235 [Zizania latifolia]
MISEIRIPFWCMKACTVALYILNSFQRSCCCGSLPMAYLRFGLLLHVLPLGMIQMPSDGFCHELVVCAGVVAFLKLLLRCNISAISGAGKDEACLCFAAGKTLVPVQMLKCSGTPCFQGVRLWSFTQSARF